MSTSGREDKFKHRGIGTKYSFPQIAQKVIMLKA